MLLPGASVLARLVTSAREATIVRLLDALGGRISAEQVRGLEELVVVEDDSRSSRLERLGQAPTRISSTGMLYALERLGEVRALASRPLTCRSCRWGGFVSWPRYGMAAKRRRSCGSRRPAGRPRC